MNKQKSVLALNLRLAVDHIDIQETLNGRVPIREEELDRLSSTALALLGDSGLSTLPVHVKSVVGLSLPACLQTFANGRVSSLEPSCTA
jgi:hypothetical protein